LSAGMMIVRSGVAVICRNACCHRRARR